MNTPFYKHKLTIEAIVTAVLIFVLVAMESFKTPGPDALLYKGLAENLMGDVGYVDNIRNDEILPTIGHPIILAGFFRAGIAEGKTIGIILFGLTLLVAYLGLRSTNLKSEISWPLLVLISFLIPTTLEFGVELSLAFSIVAGFFMLILHLKKATLFTGALLGLFIAIQILIRPIIWPFMWVVTILFVIQSLRSARFFRTNGIGLLLVFAIYFGVKESSDRQYGDSRFVTGTYSEIPLYCAFNPYIDLETNYYSSNWNELDSLTKAEGLAPLQLPEGGWQERANLLRAEVVSFVQEDPLKAARGYAYRLLRYTIIADSFSYILTFLVALSYVVMTLKGIIKRRSLLQDLLLLTLSALPVYIVAIQSVFPYVEKRYLLTPGLYLLFSVVTLQYVARYRNSQRGVS